MDGQKVTLGLPKDKDIFLEAKTNGASITLAASGNILAQTDFPMRLWLNPYLDKQLPLDFTIHIFGGTKTRCQIAIMVDCGKDKPKSAQLWFFSLERRFSRAREIKFSLILTR